MCIIYEGFSILATKRGGIHEKQVNFITCKKW